MQINYNPTTTIASNNFNIVQILPTITTFYTNKYESNPSIQAILNSPTNSKTTSTISAIYVRCVGTMNGNRLPVPIDYYSKIAAKTTINNVAVSIYCLPGQASCYTTVVNSSSRIGEVDTIPSVSSVEYWD